MQHNSASSVVKHHQNNTQNIQPVPASAPAAAPVVMANPHLHQAPPSQKQHHPNNPHHSNHHHHQQQHQQQHHHHHTNHHPMHHQSQQQPMQISGGPVPTQQWSGPHPSPAQSTHHQSQQQQQQQHHQTNQQQPGGIHHPHPPPPQSQSQQQQPQHHQQQHPGQQPGAVHHPHPSQQQHHHNQQPPHQHQPQHHHQHHQHQQQPGLHPHPHAHQSHMQPHHHSQQPGLHPNSHAHQQQPPPQQQQHNPQAQQQQQQPHHLPQQPTQLPHAMMMNQQYPHNMMYPPVASSYVPRTNHLPQYEHHHASHPADSVNLNSTQPPASINNHHPGSMPMQQMQTVISTATTGANNVNPINSVPQMMEGQMQQRPYFIPYPHFMPPYNLMMPYPFSGAPMPPNPSLIQPIRVTGDINRPQFDPQNSTQPIPTAKTAQFTGPRPILGGAIPPAAGIPAQTASTAPIKPRVKNALAIVDPVTRHVFSEAELKDSPATPQSQASKDSVSTTTTATTAPRISETDSVSIDKDTSTDSDVIVRTTGDQVPSDKPPSEKSADQSPLHEPQKPSRSPVHEAISNELESKVHTVPVSVESEPTAPVQAVAAKENGQIESKKDIDEKVLSEGVASVKISNEDRTSESLDEQENSEASDVATGDIQPMRHTQLNLPYSPGQYNPQTKTGIRRYSIAFCKAVAKEMKIELHKSSAPGPRFDFSPHYLTQNSGNYRDFPQNNTKRSSLHGNSKPRIVINTNSLQQEVELKTAEKPWKPELESEKPNIIEGEIDTKRLLKVFRGHLNKLTPQKYDSLIEKIAALDLNGDERLNSVIDLVFDKAVDEPGFCELYARMCKVIAQKDTQFSLHLVRKCQEEFETSDLYDGLRVDERKIEIEEESDDLKKKLMSEELYEDMRLRRKKYLGTIKLIGEMYKFSLLSSKIIGLCMRHLINDASNENIECLCSLIATVGAKMASENDEIKQSLKNTISILHEFTNSSKSKELQLESRIKFKILDTIDISKRNWKPRMVENNPKKIEELREEVERSKEEPMRPQHYHNHANQSKPLSKIDDRDRGRRNQPLLGQRRY